MIKTAHGRGVDRREEIEQGKNSLRNAVEVEHERGMTPSNISQKVT